MIVLAGALRTEPETTPVGGLWLVRANTKSEVEALFRTDPFWIHGLRQSYEILLWTNVLPEKTVLL